LLAALGVCVSGRRGAERSERSEDGTPAARDPSEARGTPSGDSTRKDIRLPITLSNCSNNYGPYQFPEKLIPFMILNMLDGKSLPVYVEDNVSSIWAIMTRAGAGETYNVLRGDRAAKHRPRASALRNRRRGDR